MVTTHATCFVPAPRPAVYHALLDPVAVQRWMVPDGMTSEVHEFDASPGGRFRISLTYDADTGVGKTDSRSDAFNGTFAVLVPDLEVVQLVEFETDDPQLQGVMTIRYVLHDDGDGTRVEGTHEDVPAGVDPAANELGWPMSMAKLAALVQEG